MNKLSILILLSCILVIPASAANHYIRADATGSNNGSDWDNAYTTVPSTLVRGDTYYVADGSYPAYTLNDAVSGTLYITIKKATNNDQTVTSVSGWNSSYGDGQSVFIPPFNIITSYIIFDGVIGNGTIGGINGDGSNPDNYGFRVDATVCEQNNAGLIGAPPVGYSGLTMENISISHVSMTLCGSNYANYTQNNIYSNSWYMENFTVSYCYFSNASSNILFRSWYNSTIEYNYFHDQFTGYGAQPHGQQLSGAGHLVTIRNNIFQDSMVYVTGIHDTPDKSIDWYVYNNIILRGIFTAVWGSADTGLPLHPDVVQGWRINDNTYVDNVMGSYGVLCVDNLADPAMKSYIYNELFYNITGAAASKIDAVYVEHDYNAFIDGDLTKIVSESHMQIGSGNPFVNYSLGNFRLMGSGVLIDNASLLNPPYNIDFLGITRPQGLGWDMGAYEYVAEESSNLVNFSFSNISISEAQIYQSSQSTRISVNVNDSDGYLTSVLAGITLNGIETNYTMSGGNDTWIYDFKSGTTGTYSITHFYATDNSSGSNSTTSTLSFVIFSPNSITIHSTGNYV